MRLNQSSRWHDPKMSLSVVSGRSARLSDAIHEMVSKDLNFSWEDK